MYVLVINKQLYRVKQVFELWFRAAFKGKALLVCLDKSYKHTNTK